MRRTHPDPTLKECVDLTLNCYRICEETLQHCLRSGGKHVERDHIQSLMSCVTVCDAHIRLMLSASPLHERSAKLCAAACHACFESCSFFLGDLQMKRCAEACKACAEACDTLAQQGPEAAVEMA
jgi:hypothetical protein